MTRAPIEIARLAVLRLLRERSNLFFVFAFPVLLVLLIGLSFGGGTDPRILVVAPDTDAVDAFVEAATRDGAVSATRIAHRDTALEAVGRGRGDAVVVLPEGFLAALDTGDPVDVEVVVRQESLLLRPVIDAALADVERVPRIRRATERLGGLAGAADTVAAQELRAIDLKTGVVGDEDLTFAGLSQFDLGASTQLVLFVFITTLGGATRIVEGVDLGTTRRMLAGPVSASTVVLGEGLGRFAVALFQAAWIVVASAVLFGVDWGDPIAGLVVVAAFAAAAAGAALLLGALSTNSSQANGLATVFGLSLAALGGSMAPLDIFGPTLRRVAHVTPHAWANDAFADLTRRDGGLVDVFPEVLALLGFAGVLGGLAGLLLRRRITAA